VRCPRERLIEEHMGHVRRTAGGFKCPLETEELIAVGYLALVDAAMKFNRDPDDFWPYAHMRVKGAMVDAVRRWTRYDRKKREKPPSSWDVDKVDEYAPEAVSREDFDLLVLVDAMKKDRARARVFLAHEFGFSHAEIAEMEGYSDNWACQVGSQAKKNLRREVG